ncbi:MAG: TIGR03905 family TSCPD domain-containing protein [Lentisphaeria bacterium]|nr:TIGR03905 family TSCPD domain-containing protein [Lentisphaeria bacterium]MBR4076085.1 TIGR03905 family TSCPD domain-containing protein [Lentisphaeria bacterium]
MTMKYSATPAGVCSRRMDFEIDENGIVTKVLIVGGCPGNSLGLAKLAEGRKAEEVVALLSGIRCGSKPTSCPDQLARAIAQQIRK